MEIYPQSQEVLQTFVGGGGAQTCSPHQQTSVNFRNQGREILQTFVGGRWAQTCSPPPYKRL